MRLIPVTVACALVAAVLAVPALAQETPAPPAAPEALIPDGITIEGVAVGGMTAAQASAAVEATFNTPLPFSFRVRRWQATPRQLGAVAYVEGAVNKALAAAPGSTVDLVVKLKGKTLRAYVAGLAAIFSRGAESSEVRLVSLRPRFTKPVLGITVREKELIQAIQRAFNGASRDPIEVPADEIEPDRTAESFGSVIVIRRESKRLYLYEGRKLVRKFGVATGQASYPTPIGNFEIIDKQRNPWWYPPDSDWAKDAEPVPPGPGNPLGTRWMGISAPAVGIHGTPDAASIGYSASHGCVRMLISDAEWLFEHVDHGTPVFIRAV